MEWHSLGMGEGSVTAAALPLPLATPPPQPAMTPALPPQISILLFSSLPSALPATMPFSISLLHSLYILILFSVMLCVTYSLTSSSLSVPIYVSSLPIYFFCTFYLLVLSSSLPSPLFSPGSWTVTLAWPRKDQGHTCNMLGLLWDIRLPLAWHETGLCCFELLAFAWFHILVCLVTYPHAYTHLL